MIKIPTGYRLLQNGPSTIVIEKSYEQSLLKQGIFNPESLTSSFGSRQNSHSGRGAVPSVPIDGKPQEKMLIRKYLRGGFLRFFNRDIYFGQQRPFKEILITVEASLKGIPTPDMLAAVSIKVSGPFFRGYLVSKELSACSDLPAYLTTLAGAKKKSFSLEKQSVIKRTAEIIRLMHDKGFYHADLNLKNILVDTADPHNIYLIDWDKSRFAGERLDLPERRSNVLRFCRSMVKLTGYGLPLTENDPLFFLESYWHNDGEIRKALKRLRMSSAVRSFFWKISK